MDEQDGTMLEHCIERIEINGYRPFARFDVPLRPLTLITGANGTGKTSVFEALRILSHAAENPIPPGLDPRRRSTTPFYLGGPQVMDLAITVSRPRATPLRYEVSLEGPALEPRVVRERLTTMPILGEQEEPFVFLDIHNGKGLIADVREPRRAECSAPHDELVLRQARSFALTTPSQFQAFVGSWRFYPGFDVSPEAAVRYPTHVEEAPILTENGSNLTAALTSLVLENEQAWKEVNEQFCDSIPGCKSLEVKPRGARGMTMVFLRKYEFDGLLTLADFSSGMLTLLASLALAYTSDPAPVVCLDEPELHLNPRAQRVLAAALKRAATRSQILVATHSSELASELGMDIDVHHDDHGHATFHVGTRAEATLFPMEGISGGEACVLSLKSPEGYVACPLQQ